MKKTITTAALVLVTLNVCAQKAVTIDDKATASYVAPSYVKDAKKEFQLSTGAYFFDASKKMGVFNVTKNTEGTLQFKYLGEEKSDAIFELLKDFLNNATASGKENNKVDEQMYTLVEKLVDQLATKSNALKFLQASLFRLNESAYNEDIDNEAYTKLYEIIIKTAAELQKQELLIETQLKTTVEHVELIPNKTNEESKNKEVVKETKELILSEDNK
ncbi:hypothetical protein [Flavobacterium sp.]|uniref:hypothetical protein n=1 Tax=Flavobacterium sp. TaxID=239 RepID=UPI003F69D0D3